MTDLTARLPFVPRSGGVFASSRRAGGADDALFSAFERPAAVGGASHQYLLVLRFALLNLAGGALLVAAWLQGWVDQVVAGDETRIAEGIFFVFLFGLALCAFRVWRISQELNGLHANTPLPGSWGAKYLAEVAGGEAGSRALFASALRLKIAQRIAAVRQVANALVLLGLIGTVVGFIIALSGVDPKAAGSIDAISPMVATLIQGMSVALYTTLVGAVLNLWLMANYHLLSGGAVKLVTSLVARGEANARP